MILKEMIQVELPDLGVRCLDEKPLVEAARSVNDSLAQVLWVVRRRQEASILDLVGTVQDVENLGFVVVFQDRINIFHDDNDRSLWLNLPHRPHSHYEEIGAR